MSPQDFETQLRERLHREPFQPFVVMLQQGDPLVVREPRLVIGGGGASFVNPDYELVEFNCEHVRGFESLAEATSHAA